MHQVTTVLSYPRSLDGKESTFSAGDPGLIPVSGGSPREGNGNPLQYSCLENSMDRPWGCKELDTTEQLTHTHTKYWIFSFSVSPSNEYSGLIVFVLTGLISLLSKEFSSLLQHHSSEQSIIWHSVFFTVQLSHPYVTTGKTIALTIWRMAWEKPGHVQGC